MEIKKIKHIIFVCVFLIFVQYLIIILLSRILGVGTSNTWLAIIGGNAIFVTIIIALVKIVRICIPNDKLGLVIFGLLMCTAIITLLIGIIVINVMFFSERGSTNDISLIVEYRRHIFLRG